MGEGRESEGKEGGPPGAPQGAVVAPFPEAEGLKADAERLRAELSALVVERDALVFNECKNIEMAYMRAVGGLEYKCFEMDCAILRLKRKIELMQAKKNRQEKIVLPDIEKALDSEFADYQEKLDERIADMNAALQRGKRGFRSPEETREIKKLYLGIVKALHPDLHPGQGGAKAQLFQSAVDAYKNGDLVGIRAISAMVAEPALPGAAPRTAQYITEKERLSGLIQEI